MEFFCELYRFKSLIKDQTNSPYSFQNYFVIENGLSDFHKMIVSVMKTTFQKLKPRIVHYRDYAQFSNDNFRKTLQRNLSLENINTNSNGLAIFVQVCMNTLEQIATRQKNTYVGIICHFLIKNYLAHTKKERN